MPPFQAATSSSSTVGSAPGSGTGAAEAVPDEVVDLGNGNGGARGSCKSESDPWFCLLSDLLEDLERSPDAAAIAECFVERVSGNMEVKRHGNAGENVGERLKTLGKS